MTYKNIFDSHAHYNDKAFTTTQSEQATVLEHINKSGVCGVINASWDIISAKDSITLTQKYPFFYAGVGIHPSDSSKIQGDYLWELEQLSKNEKVVAIGEIGLDYHYDDDCPHEEQLRVFEEQLQLAQKLSLPVIIHSRDAIEDTMVLLKKYKPRGVVHCFSGSAEIAEEIIKLGMYIGFTGVITFSNAKRAKKAIKVIPTDRLLLETDCPYMAPTPFRGERCDSSMIAKTAEAMAQLKQIDTQEMINIATENTCRLFGINMKGVI